MDVVSDPDTRFINHKIDPPDEIVRWLALPQSEAPIKQDRDIGRLVAMDWGNYPASTSPEEVRKRKDRAESNTGSNTDGEKAERTLEKLIENGPGADEPSVIAARYQDASNLRSGALVGSIGPLPNEDWEATHREEILLVIGRGGQDDAPAEVLDAVPVPPNTRQDEPEGNDIGDIVFARANDVAAEAIKTIIETGCEREGDDNVEQRSDSDIGYYLLQAVEFNRDVNWIRYRDFPLFASIQHRGTTNGWNKGSDHLRAAYSIGTVQGLKRLDDFYDRVHGEGEIEHPSGVVWSTLRADEERPEVSGPIALLSDGQLETVANEFLRGGAPDLVDDEHRYHRVHNTYPVGGSLADVDILATGETLNDGTPVEIAAQVSFETDSHLEKMARLTAWQDSAVESEVSQEVWYFGPEEIRDDMCDAGLSADWFVPIETLPKLFHESDRLDEEVLNAIFRVPSEEVVAIPEK